MTGLRLAGGAIANSIPGVTITPTRTEVLIIDNNGILIIRTSTTVTVVFLPTCSTSVHEISTFAN